MKNVTRNKLLTSVAGAAIAMAVAFAPSDSEAAVVSSITDLTDLEVTSVDGNGLVKVSVIGNENSNPNQANTCGGQSILVKDENCAVNGSKMIVKFDMNDNGVIKEVENGLLTGTDDSVKGKFTFNYGVDGKTSTREWTYTPTAGDPQIRYWAAKGGNGYNLFWMVDDVSKCSANEKVTNDCLDAAKYVTSGSFFTPGTGGNNKPAGLSNFTFFNGEGYVPPSDPEPNPEPNPVPLPGTVWLLLTGLITFAGFKKFS